MVTYKKNSEGMLERIETKNEVFTYDLSFLKTQRDSIAKELERYDTLIAEAIKLGVKEKVIL